MWYTVPPATSAARNVFEAEVLDPFRLAEMRDVPWPQALAGRRVLIVTSMARDVARQYERYRTDGVSWFGDAELLPPNMHLLVVASPVTYRGRAAQGNWTRSLEELEKRVAAYQFDVALLSCCLLYTSPSPRDLSTSRMPSSA